MGIFLFTDNPNLIHIVLHGRMAELKAMIELHTYQKFIPFDKQENAILYMELMKAVYGRL